MANIPLEGLRKLYGHKLRDGQLWVGHKSCMALR